MDERRLRKELAQRILKSDLPTLVKRARERKGWTQEDLARESGVSQPTLSRIEAGRAKSISATTKEALLRVLPIKREELEEALVSRKLILEIGEGAGQSQRAGEAIEEFVAVHGEVEGEPADDHPAALTFAGLKRVVTWPHERSLLKLFRQLPDNEQLAILTALRKRRNRVEKERGSLSADILAEFSRAFREHPYRRHDDKGGEE